MTNFFVLYDACVLYPAPLRDLLMHLALTGLYRAKWTNEIHDEWIRNVLVNRKDLDRKTLEKTRLLMNSHVRDCLVEGYQKLIPMLSLPDPDDRHVLAAAIHSKCSVIVTYNLTKTSTQSDSRAVGILQKLFVSFFLKLNFLVFMRNPFIMPPRCYPHLWFVFYVLKI